MPYSITTKDGITLQNIPDDVLPDSDALKKRVADIRAQRDAAAPQAPEAKPEPGFSDKLKGAGEAALTMLTAPVGAVGAVVGTGAGILESIAQGTFGTKAGVQNAEKRAAQAMQAGMYAPRTQSGQEYVQGIGEAFAPLQALGPPGAMGAMTINAATMPAKASAQLLRQQTLPAVAQAVRNPVQTVKGAATGAAQAVRDAVGMAQDVPKPTAGTMASGGAAAVDMARVRAERSANLPVPMRPTEAIATRDPILRAQEETLMKSEAGAPLRERAMDNNRALYQNFDVMRDETGAVAPDLKAAGVAIDAGLRREYKRDNVRRNVLYRRAEKAGETLEPLSIDPLQKLLATEEAIAADSPLLKKTANYVNLLQDLPSEQTNPGLLSVGNVEKVRQFVNANAGPEDMRWRRQLFDTLNQIDDTATGSKYAVARAAHRQLAEKWRDVGLVDRLMSTKKGTEDRAVALGDVVDEVVFRSKRDELPHIKGLLTRKNAPVSQQAWNEIQGATIARIRDAVYQNAARDAANQPIPSFVQFSKLMKNLEAEGKVDVLFGKAKAERLRDLLNAAEDYYSSLPGTVQSSNNDAVMWALVESGLMTMATGMPAPIVSSARAALNLNKNRKLAARVERAMNWKPEK